MKWLTCMRAVETVVCIDSCADCSYSRQTGLHPGWACWNFLPYIQITKSDDLRGVPIPNWCPLPDTTE